MKEGSLGMPSVVTYGRTTWDRHRPSRGRIARHRTRSYDRHYGGLRAQLRGAAGWVSPLSSGYR